MADHIYDGPLRLPPSFCLLNLGRLALHWSICSLHQAPAIGQISREFGETNVTVLGLLVSIFVLAFAISPLVAGPASELFGRYLNPAICS